MMATVIDPAAWFIVVNPASGAGRAARYRPLLLAALGRAGVGFRCVASAGPGDVARLAADAAATGYRRLLAVGGDGTFHEMVNGLLYAGVAAGDCLVAAAAGGTGNDWSGAMQVPQDPDRLAACMLRAAARAVDLGIAVDGRGRQLAFHNVAGAGLDAEVVRRTPARGPRKLAYLTGLARSLVAFRPPRFEVGADDRRMYGAFLLVMAAIGPRCGGGMRLTPGAEPDDGWLDLLRVDPLSLPGALSRLPRLFDGRLAGDPAFHVTRCRTASLSSDPPCEFQLDGQPCGPMPVALSIRPGALRALDCRPDVSGTPTGSGRASPHPGTAARTGSS